MKPQKKVHWKVEAVPTMRQNALRKARLERNVLNAALQHFGIDPTDGHQVPSIDTFADSNDHLFVEYWSGSNAKDGAFSMNWGLQRLGFNHTPPGLMPDVVDKTVRDASRAVVVYSAG